MTILIAIGLSAGFVMALVMTRMVASFLYGLQPNNPWTLGIASAILAIVGALAGYLPAYRASRLDPLSALREE